MELSRGRWKLPAPVAVLVISVAAMALFDVPLKVVGVSGPTI